jgi:hypothetical protein
MPTRKSSAKKIPEDGWVQELGEAESAAKRKRSAGAHLRLAIAAYKLRDFKKLKTAANLGLELDPSEGEKELLKEYVEKCKEQKEIMIDRNVLRHFITSSGGNCDIFYFSSATVPFTNLNILQYAVSNGDVTLMEEVVALGAALDFPVWDENARDLPPLPAPPGSTALLLACAMLAAVGEKERLDPNVRRDMPGQYLEYYDRVCECAIRLVHLGADCQVKLQIPARRRTDQRRNPLDPVGGLYGYRALNFGGKTAQELAILSRRRDLIRAIQVM